MILRARLSSASQAGFGVLLALIALLVGVALGAGIGPVTASRGGVAPPAAVAVQPPRMAHPAEVLRVFDGDTFEARVHLWPGLDVTTRVRLRGIDAPELKARCIEERDLAVAAREALRAILNEGQVGIMNVTLDKYGGRVLADASTSSTSSVSSAMLRANLARSYDGGKREHWCRPP
jgi:endonuclease YncB( thermonuclease family)